MFQVSIEIVQFMWNALLKVWPLLLITVPFAAVIQLTGNTDRIKSVFKQREIPAIFLAMLVGAVSPLCSCSVIPVIAALLASGVPLAPVMAFWLASPSMDPEIFFLSVTTLGWDLAVWRLAATTILSLIGGFAALSLTKAGLLSEKVLKDKPVTELFSLSRWLKKSIKKFIAKPVTKPINPQPAFAFTAAPARSNSIGAVLSSPAPQQIKPFWQRLLKEIGKSAWMVGKFMLLAYFLEALIVLYIPASFIQNLVGSQNWASVLTAALVSIPLYTTNLSALGLMGGMLEQGMSQAAALTFLIGGATTTVPAMAAVYGLTTKRIFLLYLGITICAALLFGYLFMIFG
jgi:uncharacterized membrane protein YraQ (UPF0718 family)